jgi:hypothetical protein
MAPYADEGHYIKDPDIRWVYEYDIALKTRLVKTPKPHFGPKYGEGFRFGGGFYTFMQRED